MKQVICNDVGVPIFTMEGTPAEMFIYQAFNSLLNDVTHGRMTQAQAAKQGEFLLQVQDRSQK